MTNENRSATSWGSTMREPLALAFLLLAGCGGSARVAPPKAARSDHERVVGTWTTSTESYAAATSATTAVRFRADGVLQNGTWKTSFVAEPNPGPSGPSFVARWELDPATHTLRFLLDGAEESASYVLETNARLRTEASGTTVYYARKD